MRIIKSIDEKLMRVMTYNWRYPDWEDRPQTRIATLSTLLAIAFTVVEIWRSNWLSIVLAVFWWLNAFYEWRLWYSLRKSEREPDQ